VANADELGDPLLEFLHARAVVGEPPAIEDVLDTRKKGLAIPNVRPPNVQLLSESDRSPKGRQLL